ncbi:hypothetical protein BC829DRAFT_276796 [Chytridium lagenaria]|nr:hypothetical protein BC829DRAFT_276796 [Chytridium lagenaria]
MRAPESSNPKALEHKNNFRAEYMHKQKLKQDAEAIDGFDVKVNERPRASCHVNRSIMDMSFAKMTDSVLKTTEQLESIPAGGSEFQDYHSEAAVDACHAALEMLEAVENLASSWSESHADPSGKREEVNFQGRANLAKLRVRIGIHTGPAYGCLTGGRSKIKYELVGEAMEIAELMEQQATPGTVRVSRATMNLIVKKRGPLRTTLPSNKYDEEPPHEEGAEIECPSGQGLSFIARVSVGSGVSYELRRDR